MRKLAKNTKQMEAQRPMVQLRNVAKQPKKQRKKARRQIPKMKKKMRRANKLLLMKIPTTIKQQQQVNIQKKMYM